MDGASVFREKGGVEGALVPGGFLVTLRFVGESCTGVPMYPLGTQTWRPTRHTVNSFGLLV